MLHDESLAHDEDVTPLTSKESVSEEGAEYQVWNFGVGKQGWISSEAETWSGI